MTHLRPLLIAAVLLSATHPSGSAAEPLEGIYAAGWKVSEPAGPGMIQGNGTGIRISWSDAVPASHAVQPLKRVEIGIGLGFSNDALVNGFTGRDGIYLQGFDRVAERNTVYVLPRETPRLGLNDSNALFASCCQRSNTLASRQQYANGNTALPASPSISVFAIYRKKGLDIEFMDGWKLQAGGRSKEYSQTLQTRVGFLTVERFWESLRASYSFQLERSAGLRLAPSHALLLDYLYGPRDSIGVSYTNGREIADFGTLGILNTEARSVGIRGQHLFKKDWAFTYQAGHSDHGSLPAYQAVRLALQRSF
jgi:YaiO family outer membrane protein